MASVSSTNDPGKVHSEGRVAWPQKLAGALADWTLKRLVNRSDCFGHYIAVEKRKAPDDSAYTDKGELTQAILERHYRGRSTGDLVGLHSTARDEPSGDGEAAACWSRWSAADIDRHTEDVDPESTRRAALAWYDRVVNLGFNGLLLDSNGFGGYHLLAIFDRPVSTEKAYRFARWLVRDWKAFGLTECPETYPKQASIKPKEFGNWLRLPGRHHTRDHFTRVWDGSSWLAGEAAVRAILATEGTSPDKIPAEALSNRRSNAKGNGKRVYGSDPKAAYIRAALEAEARAVATAAEGSRNNQLNRSAFALGQLIGAGVLDRADAEGTLTAAAIQAGLGERETAKTIASGIEDGMANPRDLAGVGSGPAGRNGNHAGGGFVGFVGTSAEDSSKKIEFPETPRPLSVELLPVPPLDPKMIPAPFRQWLVDIARRGCFPLEYPTAAALVGCASLIGRRLAIRPKRHDDWLVVPNLWGAVVGPPGMQKTPPVEEALRPLRRLVADAFQRNEEEVRRHNEELTVRKAQAEAASYKLKQAARKDASPERLAELATAAVKPDETPPKPKRYIVNDATIEKLGELLAENPHGLLQFRDELTGFFKTMDRQGHESDRGFYLESWNGLGSYVYDRISRGTVVIPNVCMSLFGTIQPGPLSRYLRGAAAGEDADGFMPRFQVLVYPDPSAEFVNVDRYPDPEAKNRAYSIFQAMEQMNPLERAGQSDEERKVPYLGFDPRAQEFFDQWRTDLENRLRSGADNTLVQCHLAKYRSLMPSLALVFHLIGTVQQAGGLPSVDLRAAQMAAAWCDFLEGHARRVYQAALDGDPEGAMHLAERIKQSLPNPFTFRQVAQKGWAGLGTVDDVRRAVGILEDRGWVRVVEERSGPGSEGGRTSEKIHIHPKLQGEAP